MAAVWLYSLLSVILVSLLSLIGALTFVLNDKKLKSLLFFLVALSVGALFGDAFLHLLPDMVEEFGNSAWGYVWVLFGLLLFFVLEKFLRWGHCHEAGEDHDHHSENKPLGYMTLASDTLHNFLDGIIIGASFLAGVPVGLATTLAVILHEIPQEFGHLGILLHAGYSKRRALFYNLLSALSAIVGALLILFLQDKVLGLSKYILPVAAGGFLYIAGSDLVPELHKVVSPRRSLIQFLAILLGMILMALLLFVE